jgi:RNA polymerase sigma-70 factor (ECF subfamily)
MTDPAHFEAFMRNYQNMVFTTAVRLLGNETDAEDVSQTVFLKAYQHFADLAQSPTAGGWLKTVTTHLCLNHLTRYRARWRFFSELRADTDRDEPPEVEFAAPDELQADLTAADQRRILEAALHRLPAAQRVPLVLYHFESMSYEDIAAQLKVSLAKVKTDIHRGREALRLKLRVALRGDPDAQAEFLGGDSAAPAGA